MHRIRVIDSHTEGEPTRVIIEGGPDLGVGSMAERRARFQRDFDRYRSAVVNEPRGSDVFVGALLVPPDDPSCVAGVIFFNNVGTLGMCGHGTVGVVVTLAHLGRLNAGLHRIDTPAGVVTAELHESGDVSVRNVRSYRLAKDVTVDVDGYGRFRGDIAWGGNWFFLVNEHQETIEKRRAPDPSRPVMPFGPRAAAATYALSRSASNLPATEDRGSGPSFRPLQS
jgi:4-hydroxyproline epimerase